MKRHISKINRRSFLATGALFVGGSLFAANSQSLLGRIATGGLRQDIGLIPSHFPSAVHAFVWRNWSLVPMDRMAKTINTTEQEIYQLGKWMGLPDVHKISQSQWDRSYLTVIRRNWHLLPREQLLTLMDWTNEQLEFTLIEDDFFYVKLGNLKPHCEPISWPQLKEISQNKLDEFKQQINLLFPSGIPKQAEPYFHFVDVLSKKGDTDILHNNEMSGFSPRIAYPYFALFGDPLLTTSTESYPDAYLERMHASGVDSIWMHIVLSKITPFEWDTHLSKDWEQRLLNLAELVRRVGEKGIKIFLYLNEPRHQTDSFFKRFPDLRGSGNALCTSHPEVQDYIKRSMSLITQRVPGLGGFFSITASENPTHCWSHYAGDSCPRCSKKGAGVVISELNNLYLEGISQGYKLILKSQLANEEIERPKLIVWDWGWRDGLAEEILPTLKNNSLAFMSVSEWDLPIERGGIVSKVGEYSISSIGPGPRAKRHWEVAKQYDIPRIAKIQANNSWELGAVPYIPALFNVAEHIVNLRKSGVSGLMLGWSLGGYPSPNLEVVNLLGQNKNMEAEQAIKNVAHRRYGAAAPYVVDAWKKFSMVFREFPYNIGTVYSAPLQSGPSNLLWDKPTRYKATMVGLPYDDLTSWRSIYPAEIFIKQIGLVADGFKAALDELKLKVKNIALADELMSQLQQEMNIAEAVYLHYKSVEHQSRFVVLRDKMAKLRTKDEQLNATIIQLLKDELALAERLAEVQNQDSRIGFEASNHYFYVPIDLYEKMLNCQKLIAYYGKNN